MLLTAAVILLVGAIATNVIGRRVLQRTEALLLHVPVFKTIYAPVKQLVAAFSPDNEAGFKKVVIVDDPRRGMVLGFLTKEFTLGSRARSGAVGGGVRADQPPLSRRRDGFPAIGGGFPDVTVEEGIRIFLTGGMALPDADSYEDRTRW